jgi:glyoxylase-like metal-dependent hydrolase (beta-lactamase superfamily II)
MSTKSVQRLLSTRRIGEYEVAVFWTGDVHGWKVPFVDDRPWIREGDSVVVDDAGRVSCGIYGMCIKGPGGPVVIDPCHWPQEPDVRPSRVDPGPDPRETLARIGVSPGDVSDVISTHLHIDHINGVVVGGGADLELMFPNARVLVPEADWQAYVVEDGSGRRDELRRALYPVQRAGRLERVHGGHQVRDDLILLHTGGESPGHMVVRLDTSEGPVFYLGDLVHFPIEFEYPEFSLADKDGPTLTASRRRVLGAAAESRATCVFTHGNFPCWGTVETLRPGSWAWHYEDPDAAGPVPLAAT